MIIFIEDILAIQGNYLYRIVGLKTLLTYLEDLKIPKSVSWTRDSRLNYIAGMEDVSCAKLTTIKDRLKAIGVKFNPVADPDYPKSTQDFEAEEKSLSPFSIFYGSTPMISIELWDIIMRSPESLSINKMGNDRWQFTNDIDFKSKKRRKVQYYTGTPLSEAYKNLQKYCNRYPQLFVKNKVYNWLKSGQWIKDIFKNDTVENDPYKNIRDKIFLAYQSLFVDATELTPALSKLSGREMQKYGSEFNEFNIENFTIPQYKYLFQNNPAFRAMIYDAEDLDLYKFFRVDIKDVKAQRTLLSPYLRLIHILELKIRYDSQSQSIPHIENLGMILNFQAEAALPYIKGLYLSNKEFKKWISKLKISSELMLLLKDKAIKPKYFKDDDV
jgi:hypothetical protein